MEEGRKEEQEQKSVKRRSSKWKYFACKYFSWNESKFFPHFKGFLRDGFLELASLKGYSLYRRSDCKVFLGVFIVFQPITTQGREQEQNMLPI